MIQKDHKATKRKVREEFLPKKPKKQKYIDDSFSHRVLDVDPTEHLDLPPLNYFHIHENAILHHCCHEELMIHIFE